MHVLVNECVLQEGSVYAHRNVDFLALPCDEMFFLRFLKPRKAVKSPAACRRQLAGRRISSVREARPARDPTTQKIPRERSLNELHKWKLWGTPPHFRY